MKITYLTQASLLIEFEGKKLLMDPWLVGSCWGGNIWHYPPPKIKPEEIKDIDFLYLSHAHDDHLHPESLARLNPEVRAAKTLVPDFKAPYFEKALNANGLNNIYKMNNSESISLADNTSAVMFINDQGDHDSSLLIQSNGTNIFFQTDNILSIEEAKHIGEKYDIDIVFTITSLTGIFPGFYDFKSDDMYRLALEKKTSALKYSFDIVKALGASYAIPYATDLCYLGQLYFANDIHGTNKNDYKKYVTENGNPFEVSLMGPGDFISIKNQLISFTLSEHDFAGKKLGGFAVEKRDEVYATEKLERRYENESYLEDVSKIRSLLDSKTSYWKDEPFRVLWNIIGPKGEHDSFYHRLPSNTSDYDGNESYDLRIEIPSYRLQRLVRGDYKMGFLTLQNGSIRCHRHTKNLTKIEKQFWNWAMLNLRFN